jgi:hypothetical protein
MKELYKAIAGFQQEVPHIFKGTTGYGYSYADWGETIDTVNHYMQKYQLGFTQLLEGTNLKTIIFHVESGESIESLAAIPQGVQLKGMNDFQVLGSAITYMKRYALSAALGLVTDSDPDAAGEQVKPKATKEIRNRTEEVKQGPSPMGETDADRLARAKVEINETLIAHDYNRPDQKKTFITMVLEKNTIDSLEDAHLVMDALESDPTNLNGAN